MIGFWTDVVGMLLPIRVSSTVWASRTVRMYDTFSPESAGKRKTRFVRRETRTNAWVNDVGNVIIRSTLEDDIKYQLRKNFIMFCQNLLFYPSIPRPLYNPQYLLYELYYSESKILWWRRNSWPQPNISGSRKGNKWHQNIKITLSDVMARWIPANLTSMLHLKNISLWPNGLIPSTLKESQG